MLEGEEFLVDRKKPWKPVVRLEATCLHGFFPSTKQAKLVHFRASKQKHPRSVPSPAWHLPSRVIYFQDPFDFQIDDVHQVFKNVAVLSSLWEHICGISVFCVMLQEL